MVSLATRLTHGVYDRVHRRLLDRNYDRRHGVETCGIHHPAKLGLPRDRAIQAVEYDATPTSVFRHMIKAVPGDLRRFIFIDLGSGKGRTLMMAAELPFQRIEGVELSQKMHCIALKNIVLSGNQEARVRSINLDAAEYRFPAEPFVLYLFNPFKEALISRVVSNLEQSVIRMPREGYVLYANAVYKHVFDSAKFLEPMPRPYLTRILDRAISSWPLALYRICQR